MKRTCLLSLLLLASALTGAWAQTAGGSVQFTGVIVGGQESEPVPNVYVFLPNAGRGTVTNVYGYFSLAVVPGDTVAISSIGYKKKTLVIPPKTVGTYSVIIDLQEDITQLSAITIYPYPTEEAFKEAFLAMRLPDEKDQQNMQRNLDADRVNAMMAAAPMSANENFRYFTGQQVNINANRNFNPAMNFLNPFAWAQFIKSIKRGDLKKKDRP